MKLFFTKIFLLFIILLNQNSAQQNPNYLERVFISSNDTINNISHALTPSEGILDPENYFVGPGDVFQIIVKGLDEQNFLARIDHEGNLYIPKNGLINLVDTKLIDAKKKIENKIYEYYRNVDVQISLVEFKTIKVSLIGNVATPQEFGLKGNSRLSELLFNSRIINQNSDLRKIKIINPLRKDSTYDLIKYIRLGERNQNPYLREGDIVQIDKSDKTISINGEVKYPAIYEFVENENAYDFILLSGGITDKADESNIEIISFEENNRIQTSKIFSLNELKNQNVQLKKSDKIVIRRKPEYLIERYITIEGFVKYPGVYKIQQNKTTLKDIINNAGGFIENASLKDAYLTRKTLEKSDSELERLKTIERADLTDDEYEYLKAKTRSTKGRMVVDFEKLFVQNDENENVILKEGDYIFVPEIKNYITLVGQVKNPGNINFDPKFEIDDYINMAGGFGWRAKKGDVRVIKADTGEWLEADDVEKLEAGDVIWIPEKSPGPKFWDVFTQSLSIFGQVASIVAATIAIVVTTR